MQLNFWNGVLIGFFVTFLIGSGIVGEFFISKDIFNLETIYLDGKLYKLCRVK